MREAQQMCWQHWPIAVRPVLPGALPVLQWLAQEQGLEFDLEILQKQELLVGFGIALEAYFTLLLYVDHHRAHRPEDPRWASEILRWPRPPDPAAGSVRCKTGARGWPGCRGSCRRRQGSVPGGFVVLGSIRRPDQAHSVSSKLVSCVLGIEAKPG